MSQQERIQKLSPEDRERLFRLVSTEAAHGLASTHPDVYRLQVGGIIDVVLNRIASDEYPDTIKEVAEQRNQFSAINGPRGRGYTVYGSVDADINVPSQLREVAGEYLDGREAGEPALVGGALNYANPNHSDAKNLAWINALDGPTFGVGDAIHKHGTTVGSTSVEAVFGPGPKAGVPYTVVHQTVGATLSALDNKTAQELVTSTRDLIGKEAFTQMQGTLKLAELLKLQPEKLQSIKQEMGLISPEERERINNLSEAEKTAYFENNQIITQNDEWYDLGKATIAEGSESEKLIQQTAEAYEGLDEAKQQALKEQNAEALKERATKEEQRILEAKQAAAAAAGAGMSEEMLMLMVLGAAFAYASGNTELGDQIINNMFGGGEVLLPPSASIGNNTNSTNRQKYYDDTGLITYQSDTKGQFGFAGNGSFSGVDKRLVEIMEKTAQEFPLRVRVVSGKVGRSKGDHANGLAVDIVIYDDNGDPLGSYQNPHTHRVYELFAQAAYLNTQSMHPELVDGQGLDFQWGGLFGDGQDGGYKYGSHDSMDFRLATADRFRAGTIMDGLNSKHSWYDKGDFWGGSKPFSIEAFNKDIEALHGFRMTPEQKALNDGAMGRARNTVARHAGTLESRKEEPVASVALKNLPSNLQEVLKLADINRDGSITSDESQAIAREPDSIDKIREVLTQEGVVEASNDNSLAFSGDGLQRALEAAVEKYQKDDEVSLQK